MAGEDWVLRARQVWVRRVRLAGFRFARLGARDSNWVEGLGFRWEFYQWWLEYSGEVKIIPKERLLVGSSRV